MNMEDRMATMETNHQVLQDKLEKLERDLKDEITQAQQNTVSQIAMMLGLPDPRRGKRVEDSIPVGDSPYIPEKSSQQDQEQSGMGTSKAKVQFNTGPTEINSGITHHHDPEMEIPNFDEMDDKSRTERKLEDRCEKLEELVRSMQNAATLGGIDAKELSLVNDLVIPPKFKIPEFEKFTGTSCPSAHLTMYCRKMSLYLDNEKLLIHCFQDSLIGSATRWYTQLSRAHIKTWRDLSKAFLKQYKHVSDMVPSRTVLQTMEQKTNKVSVNTLRGGGMLRPSHPTGIIVGQLKNVAASGASTQNSSKTETRSRGERKERPNFTPIPIQYEELFPKLVESRLVVPRYMAPTQPPYPPWFNPNLKCDYHAGNPGHHINDCTAFKYVVE
ncbi:hypothetical protein V6N11_038392 [Hibiscus sabdariffa]|uniref:Retrotransposon gag domain-containing protein n=1 Tax=Hibiscus sabdariffa TaxID=183260 RepID=A0ABR2SJX1_9ROSI